MSIRFISSNLYSFNKNLEILLQECYKFHLFKKIKRQQMNFLDNIIKDIEERTNLPFGVALSGAALTCAGTFCWLGREVTLGALVKGACLGIAILVINAIVLDYLKLKGDFDNAAAEGGVAILATMAIVYGLSGLTPKIVISMTLASGVGAVLPAIIYYECSRMFQPVT